MAPRSSPLLFLAGSVHYDPKGFTRSAALLRSHKPDAVLLELSPFAWMFRKRNQKSYMAALEENLSKAAPACGISMREARRHAHITAIRRQLTFPFEYRASSAYARSAGIRLFLVDYSGFSRKWIASWREMISQENIRGLLAASPIHHSADRIYDAAATSIAGDLHSYPGIVIPDEERKLWQRRECHMARKICAILRVHHPARPLYLGGWWHLTKDGRIRTLRELLNVDLCHCLLLDRGPLDSSA